MLLSIGLTSPRCLALESFTLKEVLSKAYQDNSRVNEARQRIRSSKGRHLRETMPLPPEAEVDIGGLKKDPSGSRKAGLDSFAVKQPLKPFGTHFLESRIAAAGVQIAEDRLDTVWAGVREEVIAAYVELLAETKHRRIADENLDATRQFLTRVDTRFQSGDALQSDVLRAKIEVRRAENEILETDKNIRILKGRLNLLLGRGATQDFELADYLSYEEASLDYESLKAKAMVQRSDLSAKRLELRQQEDGLLASRLKMFLPEFAVGFSRVTEEFENDTAIFLEASYPLWDLNQGDILEKSAELEIARLEHESLERAVELDVYGSFFEAEMAQKQVLLQKRSLDEANELLRQITIKYQEGEIEFLKYLENLKIIKETRLAYFNALKNFKIRLTKLETAVEDTGLSEGGIE